MLSTTVRAHGTCCNTKFLSVLQGVSFRGGINDAIVLRTETEWDEEKESYLVNHQKVMVERKPALDSGQGFCTDIYRRLFY